MILSKNEGKILSPYSKSLNFAKATRSLLQMLVLQPVINERSRGGGKGLYKLKIGSPKKKKKRDLINLTFDRIGEGRKRHTKGPLVFSNRCPLSSLIAFYNKR